ncbi:methyltransferase domain-containing protein [Haloglycomyces albus]|uniref:methyltransferase domain-containing protein n=1 Tax=Haloglycomyces albus TaxID=526067 RepID=UPI00046D13FA|nr:methyltransferase domain-containing protein [Haloglycomyces albus]
MIDLEGEGGVASGRAAVVWSVLSRELDRYLADVDGRSARIIDVGGGSGAFAVPLARLGHDVTVVDPSASALASLAQRAEEAEVEHRINALQADMDELADVVPAESADLVLCHSVLESVDDPEVALEALASVVVEGGAVSLLVANRVAMVLAKTLSGQFRAAERILHDRDGTNGSDDVMRHRYETATLTALVGSAGLVTEQVHGVGVVDDYLPIAVSGRDADSPADLMDLERTVAARVPFRDIASRLHLLARKPIQRRSIR